MLRDAAALGTLSVARIKPLLEARIGAPLALSTVYRTLARHGWRKNAPSPFELVDSQLRHTDLVTSGIAAAKPVDADVGKVDTNGCPARFEPKEVTTYNFI